MKRSALFVAVLLGGMKMLQLQASSYSNLQADATDAPPSVASSLTAQIAGDMAGVNEGHPHGVPDYWDFYSHPSISDGNHADTSCKGQPCKAIDYWGTIYVDANGSSSSNTRVNVRNCQVFWLNTGTNKWTQWGPDIAPEGIEDYPEKFDGPTTKTNKRIEPDKSMSVLPVVGKTSHFYGPYPRIPIDPANFGGVVSSCEMRLILDNASAPDDRRMARFLGNVGGDFYPQVEGPGILNNRGIAGGKYKYIKPDWRSFAMTTLSEKQLRQNPPPIKLEGTTP
jgi:hypothetical protein